MQKVHAGLELAKQQVRYVWDPQKISNCCIFLIVYILSQEHIRTGG